jgi:hypothetical protein
MPSRRKQNAEPLPWYRDPNYRGRLTEAEKRKLDGFRSEPRHPSMRYEDFADEVQRYVVALEGQIYDLKQERAATKPILCTLVAIVLVYQHYRPLSLPLLLAWSIGLLLVVIPWVVYARQWQQNAREYFPDSGASTTDEAIRREWELSYLARNSQRPESNT